MTARGPALWVLPWVLVSLLLFGCSLAGKHHCRRDGDCNPGRVCVDDTCMNPSEVCARAACALNAVSPALTGPGGRIVLEGTFGDDLQVQFPGGVTVSPSPLALHRATVAVPDRATAGNLTAVSGGVSLGPLSFRRAGFTPQLADTPARFDQIGYARRPPSLATPRHDFALFAAGATVYALGGEDGSGAPVASVERARLEADGALSSFSPVSALADAAPLAGWGFAEARGALYRLGAGTTRVERATVAAGALQPFAAAGTLGSARSDAAAVVVGNWLYALGGRDGDGHALGSVERAALKADGTLGPFSAVAPLATARWGASARILGDELFVMGGEGDSGTLDSVEVWPLAGGNDGGLDGPPGALTLTQARSFAAAVVLDGALYLFGGESAAQPLASAERGGDGGFLPAPPLDAPRGAAALLLHGNYLHLVGGLGEGGDQSGEERLAFDDGATLATMPETAASPWPQLDQPRYDCPLVALGPYLYLFGGRTGLAFGSALDDALQFEVAPDGTLSAPTEYAGVLGAPRFSSTAAVIDDSLYLIGGLDENGVEAPTLVAPINPDGTLGGDFLPARSALADARFLLWSAIAGDSLYLVGGRSDTQVDLDSLSRAPITGRDTLGDFALESEHLEAPRRGPNGLFDGSALYVVGGYNGGSYVTAIDRFPLLGDGTLGAPSSVGDLMNPRLNPTSLTLGACWLILGGIGNTFEVNAIEASCFDASGAAGPIQLFGVNLIDPRNGASTVKLGDRAYVFGGLIDQVATSQIEPLRLTAK